jgi:CheY-like chemotaxis protein
MDGWQLLASLKSSDELKGIPVVMVTSLTDNVSREKAAALGSDGYAAKPLERADLERVLRAAGVSVSA